MAFDFPSNPAIDDEYVSGGATYFWTGTTWDLQTAGTVADKVDKAGDTMTGSLVMRSDPTFGWARLDGGGAATAGLIGFYGPDDVRRGYIGWGGSATRLSMAVEGGVTGWDINTQISFGTRIGANADDISKHIELYGGTNGMGIATSTGGQFNFVLKNAAHAFNFRMAAVNKLIINSTGLTQGSVVDGQNGYFIGDRWHGMYFHGGNKLVFTEYHDHFNWRRQTSGSAFGGDQRMTLIGGNLDAAGTVSTRAVIDRSMLETRPDLEAFAAGEDPADSEIPQRGINLGKLLLHALDRIAELEARIKRFEDL
jgi:hypothetical protein